jgi:hypothetical protein
MAKVTLKFGDVEATLEDEQSAARLILELRSSERRNGQHLAPAAIATSRPARPKPPTPPSPVQDATKAALSDEPQTTSQLIAAMEKAGYVFTAKDKNVAINGALVLLKDRGEARHAGRDQHGQRLWVRGREATKN